MTPLQHKIDFAVILRVKHANPNGDPLNGNRPRTDYSGFGEISDVCLKRKMRDRLIEAGQPVFVQTADRKNDDATSLRDRAEKALGKKLGSVNLAKLACETWFDVRAFGQLFAISGKGKNDGEARESGVSVGIRGPVTIQPAFSIKPVDIASTQITKSVNSEGDGTKRGSDTIGMKHRVENSVYVFYGSINPQLAERVGFSDEDAEAIKSVLPRLFENDASSARPEGSMEIMKVIWWPHNSKSGQYSSAKVHNSLHMNPDGSGNYTLEELKDLKYEEIPGF